MAQKIIKVDSDADNWLNVCCEEANGEITVIKDNICILVSFSEKLDIKTFPGEIWGGFTAIHPSVEVGVNDISIKVVEMYSNDTGEAAYISLNKAEVEKIEDIISDFVYDNLDINYNVYHEYGDVV